MIWFYNEGNIKIVVYLCLLLIRLLCSRLTQKWKIHHRRKIIISLDDCSSLNANITQLNIDNARLIAEISEVRKQLMAAESKFQRLEIQLKDRDERVAVTTARLTEAANLTTQYRQDLETMSIR